MPFGASRLTETAPGDLRNSAALCFPTPDVVLRLGLYRARYAQIPRLELLLAPGWFISLMGYLEGQVYAALFILFDRTSFLICFPSVGTFGLAEQISDHFSGGPTPSPATAAITHNTGDWHQSLYCYHQNTSGVAWPAMHRVYHSSIVCQGQQALV